MLPLSIVPLVLAICFVSIWAVVLWLKYEEHLNAARHDPDARERVVY
jgi:hypothetical protein